MPDDKWQICLSLPQYLRGVNHAMTVAEVAALLQVSERHVYALVQNGEIPHFKVGSAVRFDPDTLRAWLEKIMTEHRVMVLEEKSSDTDDGTQIVSTLVSPAPCPVWLAFWRAHGGKLTLQRIDRFLESFP